MTKQHSVAEIYVGEAEMLGKIASFKEQFSVLGVSFPKIMAPVERESLKKLKTLLIREANKRYTIKRKKLTDGIKINRNASKAVGYTLKAVGRKRNAEAYTHNPEGYHPRKGAHPYYKNGQLKFWSEPTNIRFMLKELTHGSYKELIHPKSKAKAFIGKMKNNNLIVVQRETKDRDSIQAIQSLAIPQMLGQRDILETAQTSLNDIIYKQAERQLKRLMARKAAGNG